MSHQDKLQKLRDASQQLTDRIRNEAIVPQTHVQVNVAPQEFENSAETKRAIDMMEPATHGALTITPRSECIKIQFRDMSESLVPKTFFKRDMQDMVVGSSSESFRKWILPILNGYSHVPIQGIYDLGDFVEECL